MSDTWDRIYDAALQRHKDGGAELAQLVISADDEMRALSARVAELERELASGSFYKESDIDRLMQERDEARARVAAAYEEAAKHLDERHRGDLPDHIRSVDGEAIRTLTHPEETDALDRVRAEAVERVITEAVGMADDEDEKRYVEKRLRAAAIREYKT